MTIYKKILKHLQSETSRGGESIDLTPLFNESGLEHSEFNDILKELQDNEKLLRFDSEITTTGTQPTSIIRGRFGDIKSISLGEAYVFKFSAKLTFKGISFELK